MNIKKCSILILCIVFLLLIFSASYSQTFAASSGTVISGADKFIEDAKPDSHKTITEIGLQNISSDIYNLLLIVGIAIAAIVGVVLGIQFMTGSVETKSKVKESLLPYFAGCIVIFGAFGIWKLVITILQGIS